jgi:hypothetical protein|tara:strand:- start:62 stop:466 length:405 start_codon:yes stop_codon:yes gene_type:complete
MKKSVKKKARIYYSIIILSIVAFISGLFLKYPLKDILLIISPIILLISLSVLAFSNRFSIVVKYSSLGLLFPLCLSEIILLLIILCEYGILCAINGAVFGNIAVFLVIIGIIGFLLGAFLGFYKSNKQKAIQTK